MPKVSICIPAYRDKDGIRRLLNSIKKQTFGDFEIVLTDDTPDDSVKDVLADYTDLHIRYFHNEKSLGACKNWNRAIELSEGEYIKFMHQDDAFTFDTSLAGFVEMIESDPDCVLAFSGSRQVTVHKDDPFYMGDYYDRAISDVNLEAMRKDFRDLYNGDWVGAPSATIYRSCDVRFDPELTWIIDVDFYMGLLQHGGTFVCTGKPLVSIGVSEGQLTNSCINDGDLNLREYRHVFSKYGLGEWEAYRKRLCTIAVNYKKKYSDIKDLGIPFWEYLKVWSAKKRYLAGFYIKLVGRKISGKR